MSTLHWLPEAENWKPRLLALNQDSTSAWDAAMALANCRLDFVRTNALDAMLARALAGAVPSAPVRLAVLGSATTAHLLPAIRIGGLRRGLPVAIHEGGYGQYWQELAGPSAALDEFRPTALLLALDAHHLAAGIDAATSAAEAAAVLEDTMARIVACWRAARDRFGCPVLHQTALPVHPALLGSNEQRLPGSRAGFIARLNAALRPLADAEGVALLALDDRAAQDGIAAWHDPALWHRARQEVSPAVAPVYGDLVGRLLGALRGLSRKCLVLDLDNTLWGGTVGDDGLEGLVLGQGSALGEAHVAFQHYARALGRRGVILAVCSKNDAANALAPFERHPEMVLRRDDIACFIANWADKPANLRTIAAELNIGLDSLVFADDNPFERELVRRALPMVAVPEIGDDPSFFARILADAGYFESLAVTAEDRARGAQYQGNRQRAALQESATDLPTYLAGLDMRLLWRRFDRIGLARIVQLINKTNQFNLTTPRVSEADVRAIMDDPSAIGLQLRLVDRFGDNGVIGIVIGRLDGDTLAIEAWLMSCRVLGRQVEQATLNLLAAQAALLGARRLRGTYVPTAKNAMVRDHYAGLGFSVAGQAADGGTTALLDLAGFVPAATFIALTEDH